MMNTSKLAGAECPGPGEIELFYAPPGRLRATIGGRFSFIEVKIFRAWPLSRPDEYISMQHGGDEEFAMLMSLDELEPVSRAVAAEELKRRYLTALIREIIQIRSEFGVTYWRVNTDRGERDFVVQSLSESCIWLSEQHILILDVDGSRFEIQDRTALDPVSAQKLEAVL